MTGACYDEISQLSDGRIEIMKVRNEPKVTARPAGTTLTTLIEALASPDGVQRHIARDRLVGQREAAVPALITALRSPDKTTRWEAAKALGEIRDARSATGLVRTLDDSGSAVRWLAATALINLGRGALVPLLRGLEGNADSTWFRDGAHHVLHTLIRDGVADEAIPVLEALESLEPRVSAPVAAYHVLEELNAKAARAAVEEEATWTSL